MFGTEDLLLLLNALAAIKASDFTDDERATAVAFVREEFSARAHDARITAIAERLTAPAPVVVAKKPVARRAGA